MMDHRYCVTAGDISEIFFPSAVRQWMSFIRTKDLREKNPKLSLFAISARYKIKRVREMNKCRALAPLRIQTGLRCARLFLYLANLSHRSLCFVWADPDKKYARMTDFDDGPKRGKFPLATKSSLSE